MCKMIWDRSNSSEELNAMLDTLAQEYPLMEHGEGVHIKFIRAEAAGSLQMESAPGEITIRYGSLNAACRGVANSMCGRMVTEKMEFKNFGIMLDCSRNAVMTVTYLKKWLRRLALMGYNVVMLYTEDTYLLPEEPYFGYMRGSYTLEEMREIDNYAAALGVEMVACIQTLGHLEHVIRWIPAYRDISDTERVLLVDEPKTYDLINKMLDFWAQAFRSRRIHVGMDETHDLGRGKFMDKFGHEPFFTIYNRHLKRVIGLCEGKNLKPIIWSDMYLRAKTIPEIPRGVELCYWNYNHTDEAAYAKDISRHKELGFVPVMASAMWTYARMWYDHQHTRLVVAPCINACRKEKLQDLFFTLWGDNGAYCEFDSALCGLSWAAMLAWGKAVVTDEDSATFFETVCGGSFQDQVTAGLLSSGLNGRDEIRDCVIVWDDPLQGLVWNDAYTYHPDVWNVILDHMKALRCKLADVHARNICDVIVKKIEFRQKLLSAYRNGDRGELEKIKNGEVPIMIDALEALASSFRSQWLRRNKPFGLEVMQLRFGGLIMRYREVAERIGELLNGSTARIEELDETIQKPRGPIYPYFARCFSSNLQ